MNLTIKEIQKKLSKVKKMGFVKTLRNGPTGIGKTLETLLDIKENNISSPDLGEIELKAQREKHTGMTTLFTFNKKAWHMKPLEAIKKYGSKDKNGRLGMYYTMSMKPNSAGLFLYVDDEVVSVRNIDGNTIVEWKLSEIERRFEAKVKNVLIVKAQTEERDGIEYFKFNRARLMSHGTTKTILKNQFENEQLFVDLRLHKKENKNGGYTARNHGTGFRIFENNIGDLYERIEEIEF